MEAKFVILYRVESSRGVDLKLYNSNYYDSFFLVISVWVTDAIPMRNNVTIEWMSYRSPNLQLTVILQELFLPIKF